MEKDITTVYLDRELKVKCSKLNINISERFEEFLRILISEAEQPKEISEELNKEINDFVKTIKTAKIETKWKVFISPRCNLIRNKLGIELSPWQLQEEVEKRLNDKSNNDKDSGTGNNSPSKAV